jgi:signal transduction histidine kinase
MVVRRRTLGLAARLFVVCAVVGVVVAVGVLRPVRADARRPAILVLFVDDSSQSWIHDLTEGISRVAFRQGSSAPILYYEYLDTVRFDDPAHRAQHRRALKEKFAGRQLDLVVAVAPEAVMFVHEARDDLWPGVPVLLTSYSGAIPPSFVAKPGTSGLLFEWGFDRALKVMRSILPDTTRVALVGGSAEVERVRQSRNERAVIDAGLRVDSLADLTLADMLTRVARLPERTIVFIAGGQVDRDGSVVPTQALCDLVARTANRPTFMLGAPFLGCGTVGGLMRDFVQIGTIIGERAIGALSTSSQRVEDVPFGAISKLAFDARQLARWQIDERRLPAGSDVLFRTPSLWRDNRMLVLAALAIAIVQLGLIVGLLYERRARRRAELKARQHLSVTAHTDRQLAMGELAASMAHELKQPLAAIRLNLDVVRRLIASGRVASDEVADILREIEHEDVRAIEIIDRQRTMLQKREIERLPVDANDVVREALAIVAHHALAKRVRVDTDLSPRSCRVIGDRVLLQQVIVNLVMNAIDAMAMTPLQERRAVVSTTRAVEGIEVSIQDRGEGIAPEVLGQLFDAFVTTKPTGMGVGLAIVRGIVETHGGTIQARNNRGRGATFTFRLPAAAAAAEAPRAQIA